MKVTRFLCFERTVFISLAMDLCDKIQIFGNLIVGDVINSCRNILYKRQLIDKVCGLLNPTMLLW
jgi:hypothetical protein